MNMKKTLTVSISLILFTLVLSACQGNTTELQMTENPGNADIVIQLSADNFSFSEETITVQRGQLVRIELAVTQGFHDWVIDEFDAATAQVNAGNNTTVEFVADQAGEFEFYCSVGSHRAMGMVGTLIVQD